MPIFASVQREMSRGKVARKQNQKGKVKLVDEGVEKNAKDKDKVDAKDKVDEMRGLVLSQVQEEGLKRAFARKAILSPRFVKLLLEKLQLLPIQRTFCHLFVDTGSSRAWPTFSTSRRRRLTFRRSV